MEQGTEDRRPETEDRRHGTGETGPGIVGDRGQDTGPAQRMRKDGQGTRGQGTEDEDF